MKTLMIHEVFDMVKNEPNIDNKVNILRQNNSIALREVLKYGLNPFCKMYRNTVPSYKADYAPEGLSFSSLFNEYKKLYIFLEPTLEKIYTKGKVTSNARKDILFTEMAESIHPRESQILSSMLTGTFAKETGVDITLVQKAFPGIF